LADELLSPVRTPQRAQAWTQSYAPLPGIPDEFIGPDGKPRAYWRGFLDSLGQFDQDDLDQRLATAERRIREGGVSYRIPGETNEQSWPLSGLPLLISQAEWNEISAGVVQRAQLLDRIIADLYGDGRLVRDGALPAAVVAGSPEFLRPLAGAKPFGGRWLQFYAADIGRGPDGRWWVLGDRTQAPSGAGYALANRLVTSQAFPGLYRDMNVQRLAPFFRAFRDGLAHAAERSDPRICLLTPGAFSQTYFEQAYLARYLGFLLVEGADLVYADGKMHVRTIAGLKRADVIWRRIDAEWCDPLELNGASRLGVPGMIEAIRQGKVSMANMPGAGLLEARAFQAFMPGLARHLLGEDLRLPNIATWWCGQERQRREVLEQLDHLSVSGAFANQLPGFDGRHSALVSELSLAERERLVEAMTARGMDYVGQEVVRLSTTPSWETGGGRAQLVPRPFVLRVFAAATPDGWQVLPGGFCRVSDRSDARAVSMDASVRSADVWVLSDKPVEMETLLPSGDDVRIIRLLGNLPSRAADNLYWFGRYLERVEAILRIVRALVAKALDPDAPTRVDHGPAERLQRLLVSWDAAPRVVASSLSLDMAQSALHDENNYGSALSNTIAARRAASSIRERLSPDVWLLVGRLENILRKPLGQSAVEAGVLEQSEQALQVIAAIAGFVNENMNRVAGWNFLDMGRRIERGINTLRFASQFAGDDADLELLDVLLDLIDSQITYRSRYLTGATLAPVRDMTLLDAFNPRSVAFQAARIEEHLAGLPSLRETGMLEQPRQIALKLKSDLAVEDARRLTGQTIYDYENRLVSLAIAVADRYFLHDASEPSPGKVRGLA